MESSLKNNKLLSIALGLSIIWYGLFYQGINTAVVIWWGNEIFNHCLFVIPAAYYLIYRQRTNLDLSTIQPNYWASIPILGCLLLYAFGNAGDIQLFMHIAAFTCLPLLWLLLLGHKLSRRIAFPLLFILFSIPVGEQLIPKLQEITADMSVALLNLTGIPNFNTGLYIEIPQGRFLVAEACSGISFLIASIVIGTLFIHLNIYSVTRKLGFLAMSVAFPIFANALRVYGIIYIAYQTDMEYAAGADHLIYGWFFFAIVLMGLLLIGQLFIDKEPDEKEQNSAHIKTKPTNSPRLIYTLITAAAVVIPFQIWLQNMHSTVDISTIESPITEFAQQQTESTQLRPEFKDAYASVSAQTIVDNFPIDFFVAWYPSGHGEMLSSLNRLYNEKNWTIVKDSRSVGSIRNHQLNIATITNSVSERILAYYYRVDGKYFIDKKKAKLYQTFNILKGTHQDTAVLAISIEKALISDPGELIKLIENAEKRLLKSSSQ